MKRLNSAKINSSVLIISAILLLAFGASYTSTPSIKGGVTMLTISTSDSIFIPFTGKMDEQSVVNALSVSQEFPYTTSWSNNVLSIHPKQHLDAGSFFSIKIMQQAMSTWGKRLSRDLEIQVAVKESPQVVLTAPRGRNVDPSSIIHIIFSQQMISEEALKSKDSEKKYFHISPEVEGEWEWVGLRSIQFSATSKLPLSTRFQVSIDESIASVHGIPLKEKKMWTFTTEGILLGSLAADRTVTSSKPLELGFTQPVLLKSVKDNIRISRQNKKVPFLVDYALDEKNQVNEAVVVVHPKGGWIFNSFYKLELEKGIMGIEGNTGTPEGIETRVLTKPLLNLIPLGSELGTIGKNANIQIVSEKPIEPSALKRSIEISPQLPFSIQSYKGGEESENKYLLVVEKALVQGEQLMVTAANSLRFADGKKLKQQELKARFWVAGQLILQSLAIAEERGYKFICLRSSQPIDTTKSKASFSPKASGDSFFTTNEVARFCPPAEEGYSTLLQTQLEPNALYKLDLSQLTDIYGEKLSKNFHHSIQTPELSNKDMNISPVEDKYFRTITTPEDLLVTFETQNLQQLNIDICRIDPETVIGIETRREKGWATFIPNTNDCYLLERMQTEIPSKFWERTETKIHLADHLESVEKGTYYIRAWSHRLNTGIVGNTASYVLQFTNLHLMSKKGDNTLIWLTDTKSKNGVSAAQLTFYSGVGAILKHAKTSVQGTYITGTPNLSYEYIVATTEDDTVLTKAFWQDGISSWDFGFEGDWSKGEHLLGFVMSDQEVYKHGDTIQYTGVVRKDIDANLMVSQNHAVNVSLLDMQGEQIYRKFHSLDEFGMLSGAISIGNNLEPGIHDLAICVGAFRGFCDGDEYKKKIDIRREQKERFLFKIIADTDQAQIVNNQNVTVQISASYPFGTPLQYQRLNWKWYRELNGQLDLAQEGSINLGPDGKAQVNLKPSLESRHVEPVYYHWIAEVEDESGYKVTRKKSWLVFPAEHTLRLTTEKSEYPLQETVLIHLASKDNSGGVKAYQYSKILVYRENIEEKVLVAEHIAKTDELGEASLDLSIKQRGKYRIEAISEDLLGNILKEEKFISIVDVEKQQEDKKAFFISTDKKLYEVGEVAKVTIESTSVGFPALVTYERGRIRETKKIRIEKKTQYMEVPITKEMVPNIFISVAALNSNTPPSFNMGYTELQVSNRVYRLLLKTDLQERYSPGENIQFSVQVENANNEPTEAQLVVKLAKTISDNPISSSISDHFYRARGLRVQSADNLITSTPYINSLELSVPQEQKPAFHLAAQQMVTTEVWKEVKTDKNGKANVVISIPKEHDDWNLEIMAISKQENFGSISSSITTRSELQMKPVVPHFLRYGDRAKVKLQVENYSEKEKNLQVHLMATNLTIHSPNNPFIGLPANKAQQVSFVVEPMESNNSPLSELQWEIEGNPNISSTPVLIPLKESANPVLQTFLGRTSNSSAQEGLMLPAKEEYRKGDLAVHLSSSPVSVVSNLLTAVLKNQSGGLAQIIHHIKAISIIKSLPNTQSSKTDFPVFTSEEGEKLTWETVLAGYSESLEERQNKDGGWSISEHQTTSSPYLTAAVLEVLRSKNIANLLPAAATRRALGFLSAWVGENQSDSLAIAPLLHSAAGESILQIELPASEQFRSTESEQKNSSTLNRPYALYVLSLWGEQRDGVRNKLFNNMEELGTVDTLYLAFTFEPSSKQYAVLVEQIKKKGKKIEDTVYLPMNDSSQNTTIQATALLLKLLRNADQDKVLQEELKNYLLREASRSANYTAAQGFHIIEALEEDVKRPQESDAIGTLLINNREVQQYEFTKNIPNTQKVLRSSYQKIIPKPFGGYEFEVNGVQGDIYYALRADTYLGSELFTPVDALATLIRTYQTLGLNKVERIKVGDQLRGRISIIVPDELSLVEIVSPIPAGFELIDFSSDSAQKYGQDEKECENGECFISLSTEGKVFDKVILFDDRFVLQATKLPRGIYKYNYLVQAVVAGTFHNPPAEMRGILSQTLMARTKGEKIEIR
jgi:uncharacterized protein YfaS (alpha-2-macroglobulin family)